MDDNTHLPIPLAETALTLTWHLPVSIDQMMMPIVWVHTAHRSDLHELEQRMRTISTMQQAPEALQALSGQATMQWIAQQRRQQPALFLSVRLDLPVSAEIDLPLAGQQVHFVLKFSPLQPATRALLKTMRQSQRLLLHFTPVPEWVRTLPPHIRRGTKTGHEEEILDLVRSALPLSFSSGTLTFFTTHLFRS